MSKYAKINSGNIVEDVILCEDYNISLFSGTYIKETESTGSAHVGGSYIKDLGKFINVKPYDSWILNEDGVWESPDGFTDKPGFWWNEESEEWVALVTTTEE
jgi:hypothetical protein